MSRIDDIKNRKRQQKQVSPSHALSEPINEENNVVRKEERNMTTKEETKVERKRVSFDIRTDLHKELKMQSLIQEKNIYILIEEALEEYLKKD
ncbi:hypothetical protein [Bacillus sp. FJAT-45350]|uniref:hypothetical protein n=1 Tax=Bacillus sp. FJAT-45350 TaxID=2011014 RepID=UPI000BB73C57|nr:hypothetical protein [Bacillus sp. FJAT-45350]